MKKWVKILIWAGVFLILLFLTTFLNDRSLEDISLILPFEEDEISYEGHFSVTPFGSYLMEDTFGIERQGEGSTIFFFEVKPGTILKAAESGRISIRRNKIYENGVDPMDWELSIRINYNTFISYDHIIDLLVGDGEYVIQGQELARASPSSLRHKDPGEIHGQNAKNVDEFEFGIVEGIIPPYGICPYTYLKDDEKVKLDRIIVTANEKGFEVGDKACLKEKIQDSN